jgi:hypothetical protein
MEGISEEVDKGSIQIDQIPKNTIEKLEGNGRKRDISREIETRIESVVRKLCVKLFV